MESAIVTVTTILNTTSSQNMKLSPSWFLFIIKSIFSCIVKVTLVAVLIGFITMTDALTGVVSSLTTKNSRAEEAPIPLKLFWGCLTGGLTLICLFVLKQIGTSALQSLAVGAGLLILLITIIACYGAVRIVDGIVDDYLDHTEEGRKAIEISKAEEIDE